MPRKLLEKCCVRTFVQIEGRRVNQGSGVIVKDGENYFVLTAEHCVFGKDGEFKNVGPDQIVVEYQELYNTAFKVIKVTEIVDVDNTDDWVLLQIDDPENDCDYLRISRASNFIEQEIAFIGYQAKNPDEFRSWDGRITHIGQNEFRISLGKDTFQQNGEEGAELAIGLSGSGVFILRGRRLHLIGHLKSVVQTTALNDDLNCCPIFLLKNRLKDEIVDLGNIDLISNWEKDLEDQISNDDIELWKKERIDEFDNILRKHKVLFPEEKAIAITHQKILEFLTLKQKIENIRVIDNDKIVDYETASGTFEESVKHYYNRSTDSRKEAKDLVLKLEQEFSVYIKDIFQDNRNKLNTELARHKIIEWFMNCTFDFED